MVLVSLANVAAHSYSGLKFADGKEVAADLIVLCTGFDHNFRNDAERILGQNLADQIDEYFGMDKEGEIRGHARPAGRRYWSLVCVVFVAE